VLFSSDDYRYDGYGRVARETLSACIPGKEGNFVRLYLPARTCVVLKPAGVK